MALLQLIPDSGGGRPRGRGRHGGIRGHHVDAGRHAGAVARHDLRDLGWLLACRWEPLPASLRDAEIRRAGQDQAMDERTQGQLRVIRKVIAVTKAGGISVWLFGGWGLDARIGWITREHGDVEFWVERIHAERSKAALVGAGATVLRHARHEGAVPAAQRPAMAAEGHRRYRNTPRAGRPGEGRRPPVAVRSGSIIAAPGTSARSGGCASGEATHGAGTPGRD